MCIVFLFLSAFICCWPWFSSLSLSSLSDAGSVPPFCSYPVVGRMDGVRHKKEREERERRRERRREKEREEAIDRSMGPIRQQNTTEERCVREKNLRYKGRRPSGEKGGPLLYLSPTHTSQRRRVSSFAALFRSRDARAVNQIGITSRLVQAMLSHLLANGVVVPPGEMRSMSEPTRTDPTTKQHIHTSICSASRERTKYCDPGSL